MKKRKKNNPAVEELLPLDECLNLWPSLKSAFGHKLILSDFDAWYPDAHKLTEEKLDELISKLSILRSRKNGQQQWTVEINGLKQSIASNTTTVNGKMAAKIKLLPFLLPPHGRAKPKFKTNVIDVQQSLILQVEVKNFLYLVILNELLL